MTSNPDIMHIKMIDMLDASNVEVLIDCTNKLWINVEGKCILRIGQIDEVRIDLPKFKKTSRVGMG